MATITLAHTTSLVTHECASCSVIYGIPERMDQERHENGGTWYCPNGHAQVFRQTEVQQLNEQLERERASARNLNEALDTEKRSHAATRSQLTRITNRIQKGVCPHCNRSFSDVERHMRSKHSKQL